MHDLMCLHLHHFTLCDLMSDALSCSSADKFLPFKTPLDARYSDQIPEECRFDLEMLFASLRSFKVNYLSHTKSDYEICQL